MSHRSALDLRSYRQPEQEHHDRHTDAIVETAFQIERFAYNRRHCPVRHDRLAERRIGRREHRRQQGYGEHDRCKEEAEHDRQGQSHQQQPLRERKVSPDDAKIRVGGVGKQNHGEGHFRQNAQPLAAYVDAQYAQPNRAEDEANAGEHDRAADPGPLDPAGYRAVDEEERGQHRGSLVHLRYLPEMRYKKLIETHRCMMP